jgi:nucleotide-binding universal stress UspA family protein
MFAHILVPLDGSRQAESALPAAEALRKQFGSVITLIHLLEKDAPAAVHGEHHLQNESEAGDYLEEVARTRFPPEARVERHVHSGGVADVPAGLIEHSKELGQDLVVICVHGKGGLDRMLAGNIAERVIGQQEVPVLLVRPEAAGAAGAGFRRILTALDGEPSHEQSLPLAASLAGKTGAELLLVTVVPTRLTLRAVNRAAGIFLPAATSEYLELSKESAGAYLEDRARSAAAAGVAVSTLVVRGSPAVRIARIAAERGSDLIVLGTHGRAGTKAFWAESVTARIVEKTKIPILLVPSPRLNAGTGHE